MGTKVYLFGGPTYVTYDRGDDRIDLPGQPRPIDPDWPGFAAAGFGGGADAAINWANGYVYFFKGNRTLAYDIAHNKIAPGHPLAIAPYWPGFAAAGFDSGVDAAVNWGDGRAFFFKGDRYLEYRIADDTLAPGHPASIAAFWPGFAAAGFGSGIDAAINWGNGLAFFFKGPLYLRYVIADNRLDPPYPLPIALHWPGFFEAGYTAGIRAPVDLYDPTHELWLPGATRDPAPVRGPAYIARPWRGLLHTTEGSSLAGAVGSFRTTNFWPHLTIEPRTSTAVQHIPLEVGARALNSRATSKNAARCIQIEMVGFARQTPGWTPSQLDFVADVMRQIEQMVPIPRTTSRAFLDESGVNHNPANRMTVSEWERFSGWCGHQHSPGDTHWDPGSIDIHGLLARMRR